MSNTLFIICPFSCVENMLLRKYGLKAIFITCPGAIIPYNDASFINLLKEAIVNNNITRIYFVNDTSCRILNNVILNTSLHGLEAEYLVKSIYNQVFSMSNKRSSLLYQQFRLAELNLQFQKEEFLTNGVFTDLIIDGEIKIKTLVTDKNLRIFKESKIKSGVKTSYEL